MDVSVAENEAGRLSALRSYSILDTSPSAAFDHLTEIAADFFQVPIALITLGSTILLIP